MKEALLYEKQKDGVVRCNLCAHRCRIAAGAFGICGVRQNLNGFLYSHVYAKPVAVHVDPIEKKPLYHFLPGTDSLSLATVGCNFRCGFCQNWQISQARVKDGAQAQGIKGVSAESIVESALNNKCKSISCTYTEPTIFFEYAFDIAPRARAKGLKNVWVTNGYMTDECLAIIGPYLDAANVDLKYFKDESYKKTCGAHLMPVLNAIRKMKELKIWVEVTTLIVPGENDSEEELNAIAQFIARVDKDIPWHISRFHPDFQFADREATPEEALRIAQGIGDAAGLNYVYAGNVYGWGNDTYCQKCKALLIKREVFDVLENHARAGKCAQCNAPVPGVFA